jgi:nickel-dependent lactate racemase
LSQQSKARKPMILFATGTHRIVSENEAFKKIGNTLWVK